MEKKFSKNELINLITNYPEQSKFDWKRDINISNDIKKSELVKDVISIANAHGNTKGYIVYGVNPDLPDPFIGISNSIDDAILQQLVNSKVQKPIQFLYMEQIIDGKRIGILSINENQSKPIIISKDYGILKKDTTPIRRGSSTDFANGEDYKRMVEESLILQNESIVLNIKNAISKGDAISNVVLMYLEYVKKNDNKDEIEWALSEIKGYDYKMKSRFDDWNVHYRIVKGYICVGQINYPALPLDYIVKKNPNAFVEYTVFLHYPILELLSLVEKSSNASSFCSLSLPKDFLIRQGFSKKTLKNVDKLTFYFDINEIQKIFIAIKQRILNSIV